MYKTTVNTLVNGDMTLQKSKYYSKVHWHSVDVVPRNISFYPDICCVFVFCFLQFCALILTCSTDCCRLCSGGLRRVSGHNRLLRFADLTESETILLLKLRWCFCIIFGSCRLLNTCIMFSPHSQKPSATRQWRRKYTVTVLYCLIEQLPVPLRCTIRFLKLLTVLQFTHFSDIVLQYKRFYYWNGVLQLPD